MKIIKIIGCLVALVIGLVLLLVLTLPLWLGPVAKPSVGALLPKWTGTPVRLGHLALNPYVGRFELGDLVVENPAGYDEPIAVSLSNVVFDVAVSTIPDKVVHIEEIVVEDLFLSYVSGGKDNVNNLQQIQYNIAGGKEKYEANVAKSEQERAQAEAKAQAEPVKMSEEEQALEEKRYVIDHVLLRGLKIKFGVLTIPLPSLELHDLGSAGGRGITYSEVYEQVWDAILKAAMATGDGLKKLGGIIGDGAGELNKVADGLLKSEALKSVGSGTGKAVDAVGESTSKAVNAVGESTSKAVKSVGEGTTKAVDAVKGLFGL